MHFLLSHCLSPRLSSLLHLLYGKKHFQMLRAMGVDELRLRV